MNQSEFRPPVHPASLSVGLPVWPCVSLSLTFARSCTVIQFGPVNPFLPLSLSLENVGTGYEYHIFILRYRCHFLR